MRKALTILSYALWGLLMLLLFVYLTFPSDVLKDVATAQIQRALGPNYRVSIGDASLAGLTGITVEEVRLQPIPPGGAANVEVANAGGEGGGPPVMAAPTVIDEATVTVGLGSLMRRDPQAQFEIAIGEGTISGSYMPDPELTGGHILDVTIQGLSLQDIGVISNAAGAMVTGNASGQLQLRYTPERILHGGRVNLVVDGLARAPGPLEIPNAPAPLFFETPTRMGQLQIDAELDGSDINFNTFQAAGGPDLELNLGGRITLRNPFNESSFFLTLTFGFSPEWRQANGLDSAFESISLLRDSCDENNQCALALRGVARELRPQPLRGN